MNTSERVKLDLKIMNQNEHGDENIKEGPRVILTKRLWIGINKESFRRKEKIHH